MRRGNGMREDRRKCENNKRAKIDQKMNNTRTLPDEREKKKVKEQFLYFICVHVFKLLSPPPPLFFPFSFLTNPSSLQPQYFI